MEIPFGHVIKEVGDLKDFLENFHNATPVVLGSYHNSDLYPLLRFEVSDKYKNGVVVLDYLHKDDLEKVNNHFKLMK